ncbi:MAG: hypothetical protein AAB537_00575, partial [Patescibacteria group bacterium]
IFTFLTALIPFIIALTVIVFLWGVLKFVTAAGDEEKRKEGKGFMIWGLIGVVVMITFWGIVNLIISWTGLAETNLPASIPNLPTYINTQETQE